MKSGIIVLGHGSRREDANEEIKEIKKKLEARDINNIYLYQVAFLQFGKPNLEEALKILVKQDVKDIIVLPLFLTVGNHIYNNVPQIISAFQKKYPEIEIILAKHLGADLRIIQLLEERIKDVVDEKLFKKKKYGKNRN